MSDFNTQVIEDFRSNDGRVGGMFEGAPMVLITTVGRKSGEPRISPLVYTKDGEALVIAASKAGADEHPAWFLNIEADPKVHVEVGTEAYDSVARVAEGEERDRLYDAHAEAMPNFAEYARKTSRVIPIVVLERA